MKFADLGLSPETLKAIEDVGYETPTPIQEKAIPHVLMGRDVLGIAQTGTGKTAGFTLPMIEILANGRAKARMPRSLILAPTRELAAQVSENFVTYGKYHKLDMALLIGGESMGDQMRALDKGVDVLIATPGRLLDLFERGKVLLRDVKVLVIDEADRMLDMGFIPDVERIVTLLPPLRQTLFFSATMDKEIRKLADAFLTNPRQVSIERKATAAETVAQHLAKVARIDKREALRHILRTENVRNAFIFCNRKRDVDVLNRSLRKHGFNSISLHGDMDQPTRNEMLRRFKDGEADLLVCSDVAARGLDIDDVSHVINFDVPTHSEDYVHRIGRTGRAGKDGAAYSLATPDDDKYVAAIEKLLGRAIPVMSLEGLDTPTAEAGRGADDSGADDFVADGGRGRRRRPSRGRGSERTAEQDKERGPERATERERESGRGAERSASADSGPPARADGEAAGRARRGGRGRRDQQERDGIQSMSHADDAQAFGDHTPAFFMRDDLVPMGRALPDEVDDTAETEAAPSAATGRGARRGRGRAKGTEGAPRKTERKRHGRRAAAADVTAPEADSPAEADAGASAGEGEAADPAAVSTEAASDTPEQEAAPPARRRRATRRKAATKATTDAEAEGQAAQESQEAQEGDQAGKDAGSGTTEPAAKPKRTRTRRAVRKTDPEPADTGGDDAPAPAASAEGSDDAAPPRPKRATRARTPRKKAATEATAEAATDGETEAPAKPKRAPRRRRAPRAESASEPAGDAPSSGDDASD